eukprot:2475313-Rhodomonas_salina.4
MQLHPRGTERASMRQHLLRAIRGKESWGRYRYALTPYHATADSYTTTCIPGAICTENVVSCS